VQGKRSNSCDAYQEVPAFICQSLNQTLAKKLADGEVPVAATATDIVITADCKIVNLNGATVPETPLTVTDSSSIDLTAGATGNGHTGLTAALKVSASAGNAVVVNPDGLFVPAAVAVFDDQVISVTNTSSVAMVATPSAPVGSDNQVNYTLSADVKLSSTAGNQIVQNADGIYVAASTPYSFRVTTGNSATVPAGGIVVNSGDALHFWSNSGLGFNVTLGSAIVQVDITSVSSDAGNQLTFGSDGKLHVPGAFVTSVLDTPTVDLTVAAGVLSAATKLSATAGNTLVANARLGL
jgi:hypothetical protein